MTEVDFKTVVRENGARKAPELRDQQSHQLQLISRNNAVSSLFLGLIQ